MIAQKIHAFKILLAPFIALCGTSFAAEQARGVNRVLDLAPDARTLALGNQVFGFDGSVANVQTNASKLYSVDNTQFSFSHASLFGGAQYDWLAGFVPLSDQAGFGLAAGRFAADDILRTEEGQIYEGIDNIPRFSVSSYNLSLSGVWSRPLWSMGLSVHSLWHDYDQSGWGLRADLSGDYRPVPWFNAGALIKSLSSSYASYDGGYSEYDSPELYTGFGFHIPTPYFYGKLHLAWQSSGWFQEGARSVRPSDGDLLAAPSDSNKTPFELEGNRFTHVGSWLSVSSLAAEYQFDAGLTFRAALPEVKTPEYYTLGAGLNYKKWIDVDYAFENHPELQLTHRISVSIRPQFDFLKKSAPRTKIKVPALPSNQFEEKAPETVEKKIESSAIKSNESASNPQINTPLIPQTPPQTPAFEVEEKEEILEKK